jgi:hypothetical protein
MGFEEGVAVVEERGRRMAARLDRTERELQELKAFLW